MSEFILKVGDRMPLLRATLLDPDGGPVNLTAATTVQLRMRLQGAADPVFTSNCTIVSGADGEISYSWGATDTLVAGSYEGEFVITWSDGKKQHVPNDGTFRIKIAATLE